LALSIQIVEQFNTEIRTWNDRNEMTILAIREHPTGFEAEQGTSEDLG